MHTYLTYIHPSNIANLKLVGMFMWLDTCVYLWSLICKQAEFEITWITSWYTSSMSSHRWLSYRTLTSRDHPFLPFSQIMIQGMRWKKPSKYPHLSHRSRSSYNGTCSIFYASTNTMRAFYENRRLIDFFFSILMQ